MSDGDMRKRLDQPWYKVMYDIAPTEEGMFRESKGIILKRDYFN